MRTADFEYELPPDLIAQAPAPERDQSRLLLVHRASGKLQHRQFWDLPEYVRAGDVLVLNNSRVLPARLRARNARTGGEFELLLLEEVATNDWWAMLRPGKRARPGTEMVLRDARGEPTAIRATVMEKNAEGHGRLQFAGVNDILHELERLGEVPLPPYIERTLAGPQEADRERYQTVFAEPAGSVAAPTAGLHFTQRLLERIRAKGAEVCFVTLHVGLGTFAPVKAETVTEHVMHEERYEVSAESARVINRAKSEGRRVLAVGTTSLRVLESAARTEGSERQPSASESAEANRAGSPLPSPPQEEREKLALAFSAPPEMHAEAKPPASSAAVAVGAGRTRLFVYPPYRFRVVDGLLTNFHLPRSTLLMLVSAFAAPGETRGRELMLAAYREAVKEQYRFFSYGDAMLIV